MGSRSLQALVLALTLVFMMIGANAQVTFRAETPIVQGIPGCVQVGLFLNVSGMNQSWALLTATLDYSADMGVLSGVPEARISSFSMMTEPGLTNPATPQPPHFTGFMSSCLPSALTNSVMLTGGMPIPFMPGTGQVMVSESVNPMTMESGRITLLAGGAIETRSMEDQLFGIITFPVTGNQGAIRLNFSMAMPGSNALVDQMMMTFPAMTVDGGVNVSTAVPALSQWGLMAFAGGLLLSALFLLRRRSITS
jgi:hypothetical protein